MRERGTSSSFTRAAGKLPTPKNSSDDKEIKGKSAGIRIVWDTCASSMVPKDVRRMITQSGRGLLPGGAGNRDARRSAIRELCIAISSATRRTKMQIGREIALPPIKTKRD